MEHVMRRIWLTAATAVLTAVLGLTLHGAAEAG